MRTFSRTPPLADRLDNHASRADLPGDEYRLISRGAGYRYVLVNGQVTIEDDQQTNVYAGLL